MFNAATAGAAGGVDGGGVVDTVLTVDGVDDDGLDIERAWSELEME